MDVSDNNTTGQTRFPTGVPAQPFTLTGKPLSQRAQNLSITPNSQAEVTQRPDPELIREQVKASLKAS